MYPFTRRASTTNDAANVFPIYLLSMSLYKIYPVTNNCRLIPNHCRSHFGFRITLSFFLPLLFSITDIMPISTTISTLFTCPSQLTVPEAVNLCFLLTLSALYLNLFVTVYRYHVMRGCDCGRLPLYPTLFPYFGHALLLIFNAAGFIRQATCVLNCSRWALRGYR